MENKKISVKNILVIGDLMIDHYIYGNCNRISPEAPVPVIEITKEFYTLGGAGNVLQNLIALGCRSNIVAVVGDDDNAGIARKELKAVGVEEKGLFTDSSRCTIVKSRVLVANHQMIRLDRERLDEVNRTVQSSMLKYLEKQIPASDIVLISDYGKGLLTPDFLTAIVKLCSRYNKLIIVDPKGNDFSKYNGVSAIKPNKKEAIIASGIKIHDQATLLAACKKIKEVANCDSVIITMSEDGIACYSDDILQVIPTKALDVIDVTGAGDTVLASLGLALASGVSLFEACDFANHAAAVVVNKVGSATATLSEIDYKF